VDALCARALAGDPADRYASAAEMLEALEQALPLAPPRDVALAVQRLSGDRIAALQDRVRDGLDAPEVATPVDAPPATTATHRAPREVITAIALAAAGLLGVSFLLSAARARPHGEAPAASAPSGSPGNVEPSAPASAASAIEAPGPTVTPPRAGPAHNAPPGSARARPSLRPTSKDPPPPSELHPSPYGRAP
jgi:hypothetical protein